MKVETAPPQSVEGSSGIDSAVGIVGSAAVVGSAGVVGSAAVARSSAIVGSAAVAGSTCVVGSAGVALSAGVVGSAGIIAGLGNVDRVDVLPFHKLGASKYEALDIPFPLRDNPVPEPALTERVREQFRERGLVTY